MGIKVSSYQQCLFICFSITEGKVRRKMILKTECTSQGSWVHPRVMMNALVLHFNSKSYKPPFQLQCPGEEGRELKKIGILKGIENLLMWTSHDFVIHCGLSITKRVMVEVQPRCLWLVSAQVNARCPIFTTLLQLYIRNKIGSLYDKPFFRYFEYPTWRLYT